MKQSDIQAGEVGAIDLLNDICWHAHSTQTKIAIIGAVGSGKSSLATKIECIKQAHGLDFFVGEYYRVSEFSEDVNLIVLRLTNVHTAATLSNKLGADRRMMAELLCLPRHQAVFRFAHSLTHQTVDL